LDERRPDIWTNGGRIFGQTAAGDSDEQRPDIWTTGGRIFGWTEAGYLDERRPDIRTNGGRRLGWIAAWSFSAISSKVHKIWGFLICSFHCSCSLDSAVYLKKWYFLDWYYLISQLIRPHIWHFIFALGFEIHILIKNVWIRSILLSAAISLCNMVYCLLAPLGGQMNCRYVIYYLFTNALPQLMRFNRVYFRVLWDRFAINR